MPHRKISRGPPELLNIIRELANTNNINNFNYVLEFGSEDVDSYINGVYKVRLKGYRDGQKITKTYIVKHYSVSKKKLAQRDSYQRETFYYKKIVPKLLEVQRGYKVIDGLKIKFPNCDFVSSEWNKEVVAVSDPQEEGFKFHDRFHKLDLDHVSLVLKNLAKLHALSFTLEKSQPREFEEIRKDCCVDVQYSDTKHVSESMVSYYNASVNIVKDEYMKKKLQIMGPNILLILNKCAMPDTNHRVICHGDCWNNNTVFKYQKTRPVEMLLIDCQLIRYASPVTDLSYYLYMSTDHEFLSKHYERVVNLYYKTLSAVLRQCNLAVQDIYPEDVFQQHLREYSVFGLIESLISMKIITAKPEDALQMTEVKHEFCEDGLAEDESRNSSLYVERVNGVVTDFFSRGYSLDDVLNK